MAADTDFDIDSPLYRKQIGADSLTYYLAYRSVVLRPSTAIPGNLDQLLPGTVAITITPETQKPYLTIFADEIVLLTGSRYDFPGTNLSIHCRSIRFFDLGPGPITFDLSGRPNDSAKTDGEQPQNGAAATFTPKYSKRDSPWEWGYESDLGVIANAAQGVKGGKGSEGQPGNPGGSFTMTCDVDCREDEVAQYSILVKTKGGAGSAGGNGSKGGKGGNGALLPADFGTSEGVVDVHAFAFFYVAPSLFPAMGGHGGDAGHGGYGGNGGDVNISFLLNGQQASSEQTKSLLQVDVSGGESGNDGKPGAPGDSGNNSELQLRMMLPGNPAYRLQLRDEWRRDSGGVDVLDAQGEFKLPYLEVSHYDPKEPYNPGLTILRTDPTKIKPIGTQPGNGGLLDRTKVSGVPPVGGKVNIRAMSSREDLSSAFNADYRYISMILDRLKFEYHICFTIQKYVSDNDNDLTDSDERKYLIARYQASKEWIENIMQSIENQSLEALKTATPLQRLQIQNLQATYSRFQEMTGYGFDIYGNGLQRVPEPSWGIADMEKFNENYNKMEETLAGVATALKQTESMSSEQRLKLASTLQEVNQSLDNRNLILEELSSLHGKIIAADGEVQLKKKHLELDLGLVKQNIAAQVNCNFSDILSALSTVSLFYNPEAGAMYAIGSLASGGDALHKTIDGALGSLPTESGGRIEKKYLYHRINTISEDTTTPLETLKDEFARAKGEKLHNPDYLSQVRMQESKFNEMCSQYYQIEGVAPAKAAFRNLINAIQTKSDLLDEYNRAFIKLARQQVETDNLKAAVNMLNVEQPQTDTLQVANTFLEQTRSEMKKLILYKLYNVIRTFNCISMSYSELALPLAKLHSFHGVDSTTLSAAYNTYFLQKDIPRLRAMHHAHRGASEVVELDVTEADYADNFEALRSTGTFTFTWDPKLICDLGPRGFEDDWFDARFSTAEIYFVGATRIEKRGTAEQEHIIHTIVSTSGVSTVLDSKLEVHKFVLPETSVPFSYTYDSTEEASGKAPGTEGLKPYSSQILADVFRYELEPGHDHDLFLQTPLTTWQAEISGYHSEEEMKKNPDLVSKVDLKNCWTVRFRFNVFYRSKTKVAQPEDSVDDTVKVN